ncbi:MAG: PHP-associated domain-containing protein [Acidimicrobiales bacterium]
MSGEQHHGGAGTCRIDLHSHTYRSGDSVTGIASFVEAFASSGLDMIAVTDHGTTLGAREIAARLGPRCIIGQETRTDLGEVIGLYLEESLPRLGRFVDVAAAIRAQGGLVYVPHPGDSARHSIQIAELMAIAGEGLVDIIEVGNGKRASEATYYGLCDLADQLGIAKACASDAHVPAAIGTSYVELATHPMTPHSLLDKLKDARLSWNHVDPPRFWSPQVLPPSPEGH